MIYDHILVRYGELTLKGANRKKFVNQLRANTQSALSSFEELKIKANRDRMYIEITEETDVESVIGRLKEIIGVKSVSPVSVSYTHLTLPTKRIV